MIMAHDIPPRLDDLARIRAAFVHCLPVTNMRQVECHAR
jgi:hypothetical protein